MMPTLPAPVIEWFRRNPERTEVTAGVLTFLVVLAASLLQWGVTDIGWARGVSLGVVTGLTLAWYYRRRRRREEQRERALLEQRLQLARELHDAVAGQVAVVGIQAAAARRVLTSAPEDAAIALERIETASRSAIADLRRMLLTLRDAGEPGRPGQAGDTSTEQPGMTSEPGLDELGALIKSARESGQPIELRVVGDRPTDLPPSVDHAGYRVVQEAVTNAVKHAPGAATTVAVTYERQAVRLSVVNGPSQRPGAPWPGAGLGLIGMRERAALFRGSVAAGPTADGGWSVAVELESGRAAD
jgi:signal transduction histidine kinase